MTTYFAQSNGNIDGAGRWNTAANGSGTALTWPPASGDVLMANNRTITVNVDTNLGATGEVRNDTTGGATAGNYFSLGSGIVLTANVYGSNSYGAACVTASSSTSYIVGNIYGGTNTNCQGAGNNSTGTLYITGNCYSGSGGSASAVLNISNGKIIVNGSVYGGTISNSAGAYNSSNGYIQVIGNAFGGISANCFGANNAGGGTLTVGTAIGNGFGNGSVGLGSAPGVSNSQTGTCTVKSIQYGARGQTPTVGPIFIEPDDGNQAIFIKSDLTTLTLARTDGTDFGIPSASDVRYGTSYALGSKTGTCHVPTASQVSAGIAVDHTTGTAVITEANVKAAIWDAATSSLTTAGSIGERLKNCATVESTGEQLEGLI